MAGLEVPRVTNFLFCFSLKFGALFIGYFSLASAVAYLSLTYNYILALYAEQNKDETLHVASPEDFDSKALKLYIIYGLQLFIFMLYFIISLLLVIGAHKRLPRYMRHYYRAGLINLVMNLVVVTVSFVFFNNYLTIVSQLLICGIIFYFLLVVRSAFLEMEEQARPRDYEKNLYKPTQQTPQPVHTALVKD